MTASRTLLKSFCSLLLLSAGCSGNVKEERSAIAVTLPQEAAILRSLAGDEYDIITLVPPGSDPESYEISMRDMRRLSHASLYMTMNTPGFEESMALRIAENFPSLRLVDVTEGIVRLSHSHSAADECGEMGSHSHDDAHGDSHNDSHSGSHNDSHGDSHNDSHRADDPHILTSPLNAIAIGRNMTSQLSRLSPSRRHIYAARMDSLEREMLHADSVLRKAFSNGSRAFVTGHASLSYLSRDYGLHQIALESEGKEPTPKQYVRYLAMADSLHPSLFVIDRLHDTPRLREAAAMSGLPVVDVDLDSEQWINSLYKIAKAYDSAR